MSTTTLPSPTGVTGLARLVQLAARASSRRPRLVIALWVALIAGCCVGGAMVGTRSLSNAAAGSGESGQAEMRLQHAGLLNRFNESLIIRSGSASATVSAVSALRSRAQHTRYVADVSPAILRDGGRIALLDATLRGNPDQADTRVLPLQHTVSVTARGRPGVYVGQAGDGSFARAQNQTISSGMSSADMIAFPLTLLILVAAFGALVAAVVPLTLGLSAVAAGMGALGLVSQLAPNGTVTSPVVVLFGLAVGVDYSLFYIRRVRAERHGGAGAHSALDASAATVGRAILVAGTTVIIGLAGLLFTGNPVFVSMALGAILVVTIAVLGSLTVLPATLALLGDRIDRGRLWRRRASIRSGWGQLARRVTARPRLSLGLALCLLVVLAAPLLSITIGNAGSSDLPPSNPTVVAQRLIDRSFGGGIDRAQLVVSGHGLGSAASKQQLLVLGRLGRRTAGGAAGSVRVAVAADGSTAVVGIPVPTGGTDVQNRQTARLRAVLKPATARMLPGAHAQLTGDGASNVDFNHQMSVMTPLVIAFVLALAFILLRLSFGSSPLALSVIGLNLVSVGGAFGVLTALFQFHWAGQLVGLRSFGAIVDWLPLFAFVVLFGMSMDYTVLILERAAEARRRGLSARAAAAEALAATGSTVTSAALVMVAVFSTFATVPLVSFKQMGIGLAVAIALDATIVRGIALPALLTLLGDRGLPRTAHAQSRTRAWEDHSRAVVLDASHD